MSTTDNFAAITWGRMGKSERDKNIVQMLCSLGSVTKWCHDEDDNTHVPWFYNIQGIEVEYLPNNWGYYSVDGLGLRLPTAPAEIRHAVELLLELRKLGYSPKKT